MCFSTRVCLQRFVGRRPPAGFQVEEGVKREQGDGQKKDNNNEEGAKGREARREAPPSGMRVPEWRERLHCPTPAIQRET